jgi:hypothetical protein
MNQDRQNFLSLVAGINGPSEPRLRRRHHPEVARPPAFLKPRPQGGWATTEKPVRIQGFDLEEDVIAVSLPSGVDLPRLTLRRNPNRPIVTLRADGKVIARIFDAPEGLSLHHVRVSCHAASL